MALIQMSYLSWALYRTVPVTVILPTDSISMQTGEYLMPPDGRFKTLYLLHGLLGSSGDWVEGTRIRAWAEEKRLAVVMPSGDNAFYVNGPHAFSAYGDFIGKELVEMTRRTFPLSNRREDTFIAGLSMGGYGAIRNGLKYSETFSCVAGFSSALHIFRDGKSTAEKLGAFSDLQEAAETDKNPEIALKNVLQEGRPLPKFYLSCGLSDPLLEDNRYFCSILKNNGADVTWDEEPGGHEWMFWDRQIKKTLDWLPLDPSVKIAGSGSVPGVTQSTEN